MTNAAVFVDCACVIHGDAYDWIYVERLHSMLHKHLSNQVRLHVFTESQRPVPENMVKHSLHQWPGVSGPKKSWWYKIQMFDPGRIQGRVLYFDLDTVIVRNIDWMLDLDPRFLWTVKDFKHLWRSNHQGVNSSVMVWDTRCHDYIWNNFQKQGFGNVVGRYRGDQDYIDASVDRKFLKFFDQNLVRSWRWEIKDGGMDFRTRNYLQPNAGSILDETTAIMVFHGQPKPHDVQDPVVSAAWN